MFIRTAARRLRVAFLLGAACSLVACGSAVQDSPASTGTEATVTAAEETATVSTKEVPERCLGVQREWPFPRDGAATSSDWIVNTHDCILKMRPRLLVFDFANGLPAGRYIDGVWHAALDNVSAGPFTSADARRKAEEFVYMLREASRYQPRRNPAAQPFLEPEIVKVVSMKDGTAHANSASFPRGTVADTTTGARLVGYYQLLSEQRYAQAAGFRDERGRLLTLAQAHERGLFHEIVMIANQVDAKPQNPADQVTSNILEVAFVAQAYGRGPGNTMVRIPGEYVRNGVLNERQKADMSYATAADYNSLPWTGRSMRVYFLNAVRGAGCLMHSLGHEFEFRYNDAAIYSPGSTRYHGQSPYPFIQPYFRRYADFDMRTKYGWPISSLYEAEGHYNYGPIGGGIGEFRLNDIPPNTYWSLGNYQPVAGNVHYPPGARKGYDYRSPIVVKSTMETFLQPGSTAIPFDRSAWSYLTNNPRIDADCGGDFLTFWFQNMPGLGNRALDDAGNKMKNWWPYMYY